MRAKVRSLVILFLVGLVGVLGVAPANAAWSSWEQIPDDVKNNVIIPVWKDLRSKGYTEEAAAGVMGNMNQEAGFDPTSINWIDCRGMFQWCHDPGRKANMMAFDSGHSWDTWEHQMAYFHHEVPAMGDWFSTGNGNIRRYEASSGESIAVADYEAFKASTNMKQVVAIFLVAWEIPCPNAQTGSCAKEMERRVPMAQFIYDNLKGTPVDGAPAGGSAPGAANCPSTPPPAPSASATPEAPAAPAPSDAATGATEATPTPAPAADPCSPSIGGGGMVIDEGDLLGMPKTVNLNDGAVKVELPDSKSLSDADRFALEEIQRNQTLGQDTVVMSIVKTAVNVLAVLILFWGLAILLAGLFDKSNNFFDGSMVKVLTFGRREFVPENSERSKGQMGWWGLAVTVGSAWMLGIFVLSGALFLLLGRALNAVL